MSDYDAGLRLPWVVSGDGGSWRITSTAGDVIADDIPHGAVADHIADLHNGCDGTGHLPRSMGAIEQGEVTGLCISCQTFQPMYEVIPPSKPEWKREFRLAPHPRTALSTRNG